MKQQSYWRDKAVPLLGLLLVLLLGCNAKSGSAGTSPSAMNPAPPARAAVAGSPQNPDSDTPAPEKTGGFDGKRAWEHVARQVAFGPRPAGSSAIGQTQDYLLAQLNSFGCHVDTDAFYSDTPAGRLPMKNIVVKIPGDRPGIILLATHYDTKRLDNFVGADDAGSSTAVMLELARLLCPQHGRYKVWIAFLDGEEAVKDWSDTDSRYGSRQMAARLAATGELQSVKALLLADIVGGRTLHFDRESNSTKALVDLVWSTAKNLGYSELFLNDAAPIDDDHQSFLKRGVPAVDVIGDFSASGYWHTPQDTLDKISSKNLAIVGHVFLESVKQLQAK